MSTDPQRTRVRGQDHLKTPNGLIIERTFKFGFPVSNIKAKYEALFQGLCLAKELSESVIQVYSDSQLILKQGGGEPVIII